MHALALAPLRQAYSWWSWRFSPSQRLRRDLRKYTSHLQKKKINPQSLSEPPAGFLQLFPLWFHSHFKCLTNFKRCWYLSADNKGGCFEKKNEVVFLKSHLCNTDFSLRLSLLKFRSVCVLNLDREGIVHKHGGGCSAWRLRWHVSPWSARVSYPALVGRLPVCAHPRRADMAMT